jgi:hypothetical protein
MPRTQNDDNNCSGIAMALRQLRTIEDALDAPVVTRVTHARVTL